MMQILAGWLLVFQPPLLASSGSSLQSRLTEWGVAFHGLTDFAIAPVESSGTAGQMSVAELSAVSGDRKIHITRVTNMDAGSADRYIADHKAQIGALYKQRSEGYFPVQAHGRICEKHMRPSFRDVKHGENLVSAVLLYATNRYVLGACLSGQGKFRVIAVFAYCRGKKELYDITYFSPAKTFSRAEENALISFDCGTLNHPD